MGIKRIVDTDFWYDQKVMEIFSPEDRLFYLYLMTNPHTSQLGIYKIIPKQMAFELGYSLDTISVLLDRFEHKYAMIRYSQDTCEVAIKHYLDYSIIAGGKPVLDLLKKETEAVRDKTLLSFIVADKTNNKTVKDFFSYLYTLYRFKSNDNHNDNDNDNEKSYPHSSANRGTNRITNRGANRQDGDAVIEAKNPAEIVPDDNFADIYTAFENELGRPLSIIESEKIIEWHKTMKKELILEALKRAILNNVKTMQYIGGILNSWEKSGLKCLNDVLEADKHRERNKKAAGVSGKATSNRSFRNGQETIYSDEIYEVF